MEYTGRNSTAARGREILHRQLNYMYGGYSPAQTDDLDELMAMGSIVGADVITDWYFILSDLHKKQYGMAGVSAAAMLIPGMPASVAKAGVNTLAQKATYLHSLLHKFKQMLTTTAVARAKTPDGIIVELVAHSDNYLPKEIKDALMKDSME